MTDAFSALCSRLRSLPRGAFARAGVAARSALPAAGLGLALVLLLPAAAPAFLPASAHAQTRGDGSAYSRFGLGDLYRFSSSQAQAMGGGGLALRSLNYTGFSNPALWSDQELTRLSIGGRYRRVDVQNDAGQTSRLSAGTLEGIQFSFPLLSQKLGAALSFQPYSRVEYRIQNAPQPVPGDSANYTTRFEGTGGLQQISGGLGYRLNDALSVGARADVVFGIIEDQRRTTFDSPRFRRTTLARRTRLAGVTGTVGALLSLGDVLSADDAFSAGAAFTLPTSLSGERTRTLGENLDRDTLETNSDGSVDLPLRANLGLAYKPDARWTIIADGAFAPWSGAESDFTTLPGFNALRDRARASAGVEFLPAGEVRNEPYFARTAYRLGAYYEQSYVEAATIPDLATSSHTGINTLAATGGLSFPTPVFGTRIDVGVEVGTRGTTTEGLVRELFYGLSLRLNAGERWFQRRKLR